MSNQVYSISASIIFFHRTLIEWFHHDMLSCLTFTLLGLGVLGFACFRLQVPSFLLWHSYVIGHTSTRHSLPPTTNNSTIVVQSSYFHYSILITQVVLDISNIGTIIHWPAFDYMIYMFSTCKGYGTSILFLSAVHHESSCLAESHNLYRKDADLHVLS